MKLPIKMIMAISYLRKANYVGIEIMFCFYKAPYKRTSIFPQIHQSLKLQQERKKMKLCLPIGLFLVLAFVHEAIMGKINGENLQSEMEYHQDFKCKSTNAETAFDGTLLRDRSYAPWSLLKMFHRTQHRGFSLKKCEF